MLSLMDGCPFHWNIYENLSGVNEMKLQACVDSWSMMIDAHKNRRGMKYVANLSSDAMKSSKPYEIIQKFDIIYYLLLILVLN
jgi:hypothetical protein